MAIPATSAGGSTFLIAIGNTLSLFGSLLQVPRYHQFLLFWRGAGPQFYRQQFLRMLAGCLFPVAVQVWLWRTVVWWVTTPRGEHAEAWKALAILDTPQAWPYYGWSLLMFGLYAYNRLSFEWLFRRGRYELRGFAGRPVQLGLRAAWWNQFLVFPSLYFAAAVPFLAAGYWFGMFLLANGVRLFADTLVKYEQQALSRENRWQSYQRYDPFDPVWSQSRYQDHETHRRRRPFDVHDSD